MAVHVLLDTIFFRTSMPIAAQQRILPLPPNRGLNAGDTIFLRNEAGSLTWVAEVLLTGEFDSVDSWSGKEPVTERYAITGYLARIHEGVLPPGKSKLQSPWVTLNRRTLENTLPWWDTHVLLYHSTLHLVEGILTPEEVREGLRLNCLMQHPSGHIVVPHGEARKRLLVYVKGIELQCSLCHGPIASIEEATQDHVIPISQGGPDALSNIELTHRACNELKGNALPEQYPPIFPVPGSDAASWRASSFRNGRHVHPRRTSRRGPTSAPARRPQSLFTAPVRGTGIPSSVQEEMTQRLEQVAPATKKPGSSSTSAGTPSATSSAGGSNGRTASAGATPAGSSGRDAGTKGHGKGNNGTAKGESTAATTTPASARGTDSDRGKAARPSAATADARPSGGVAAEKQEKPAAAKSAAATSAGEPLGTDSLPTGQPAAEQPPADQQAGSQPAAAASAPAKSGVVEVDPEWLVHVQRCSWEDLMQLAVERDWAAKTAALRTLEQLSRAEGKTARTDGKLLAEAEGPKGRFQLYEWKDQIVLTEERGNRHSYFLVKELAAIDWNTYLWYLKHFGRTTPLAVAMSLLTHWRQGEPESGNLVRAEKNGQVFQMQLEDGQLRVTEAPASSDVA